ncbi:MAG TPA: plastocyanin/azurin family copper-binding protein [Gemmatimonadales bacterium]
MRKTLMVAGMTMILAACGGGEKKAEEQPAGAPDTGAAANAPAANAPAATAPAGTGKTHDVNMVLDGSKYKFDPEDLTIQSGDVVRYHNKSGGPHNVSFWADSIPSGAADVLKKNMPNQMAPLESPLETEPNAVYEISFAGAPKGEYKYYCLPHLALGMKAKLTVK